MAKVQDRRNLTMLAEHGKAIREAAMRLEMHTATHDMNTEAGRILDQRIIVEELAAIQGRIIGIMGVLLTGGK